MPAGLSDDPLELVHLLLGATEGAEPLLCQLACTFVLIISEEFNDAALVGGEAVAREETEVSLVLKNHDRGANECLTQQPP